MPDDPNPPDDEARSRPTPVRQAMEAQRETPEPVAAPATEFEAGDETWIVRVEGRSVTGRPPDAGAPLLLLTFARAAEPDRRLQEVLAVGRTLEGFHPDELRRLLDRSRPFDPEWEPTGIFPHTSRGRGR